MDERTFSTVLPQGYHIDYDKPPKSSKYKHVFCGENPVKSAQCPDCRKPLYRHLLLDMTDPRFHIEGYELASLPLYYCWRCGVAQAQSFYRPKANDEIKILKYGKERPDPYDEFPYEYYPDHLPAAIPTFTKVTKEEHELALLSYTDYDAFSDRRFSRNNTARVGECHQIGGIPFTWQGHPDENLACVKCKKPMPYLATIADDAPGCTVIIGNSTVMVHYGLCVRCNVVGAYQDCD
jgi:hypothetical protein